MDRDRSGVPKLGPFNRCKEAEAEVGGVTEGERAGDWLGENQSELKSSFTCICLAR